MGEDSDGTDGMDECGECVAVAAASAAVQAAPNATLRRSSNACPRCGEELDDCGVCRLRNDSEWNGES